MPGNTLDQATAYLLALKSDIAAVRLRLALKRFNPDQPRWPAGQSDGGQWRPAGWKRRFGC